MLGDDFLFDLLDKVDGVCEKIDNSLNELFHKLLEVDFFYIPLIDLQERFLSQVFTEAFFDHASHLMKQSPRFERNLAPVLGKEIDTIRQNMEDGEKVLRNIDFYAVEAMELLKSYSPTVYRECQESVRHLTRKYIVSSSFKSIRTFFMFAKLQEKLEINKA